MRLLVKRMLRTQLARPFGVPVPNVLTSLFVLLLVFAGGLSLAMMEHTRNAGVVYDDFYEATNLADLTVTAEAWPYAAENMLAACEDLNSTLEIAGCETRYIHDEKFVRPVDGELIPARYHGYETVAGQFGSISTVWQGPDDGRMPTSVDEVVIDRHMHDELGIEIGDEVTLILMGVNVTKTVVGYGNHADHLWYVADHASLLPGEGEFASVYMPISALLAALGQNADNRTLMLVDVVATPDYDLLDTDANEGVALDALALNLSLALAEHEVSAIHVEDRSAMWSVELLRQDLEGNRKTLPLFTGILVGVSALVIAISQDRLVRKQSREIAVLTSLGTPPRDILMSYLTVPVVLGTIGGLGAVGAGILGSEALTSWYFNDMVGVPVTTIHHHTDLMLLTWLVVFGITVGAGLFPAWRATRLKPLEVMRGASARKPGRLMQRLTAWLPTTIGLGVRSTFRRPIRLGTTVLALGMAMVLVGGTMLMVGSMEDWFRASLGEDDTWDVRVSYDMFDDDELLNWTEQNSDAYEYEWSFIWPVTEVGDDRRLSLHMVEGFGEDGIDSMHAMRLLEGRLPVADENTTEALIDRGVAEFLGVRIGDDFDLQVTTNGAIRVRVVGIVEEMERSAWVHHSDVYAEVEAIFGDKLLAMDLELNNTLHIRGVNLSDSGLNDINGLTVIDRQASIDAFEESWERQQVGFVVFLVIGWTIAVAVLINTLMINLTEHDTEFATLRILGASSWRLSGILLVESIMIGFIGGIIGALASMATAFAMSAAFTNWMWTFPMEQNPLIVLQILGMIVMFSVLITPIGLWRIWRMDLVEKAKEYAE
jgi:putative ABC transport system permease protein